MWRRINEKASRRDAEAQREKNRVWLPPTGKLQSRFLTVCEALWNKFETRRNNETTLDFRCFVVASCFTSFSRHEIRSFFDLAVLLLPPRDGKSGKKDGSFPELLFLLGSDPDIFAGLGNVPALLLYHRAD